MQETIGIFADKPDMPYNKKPLKVLDLFSGLEGWSKSFRDRGHDVITVDFEAKFHPTICANILTLNPKDFKKFGKIHIILSSPPCNCFSVASISTYWSGGKNQYVPKNEKTVTAIETVKHTLKLIKELNPSYWVLENPVGVLRSLPFMKLYHRHTVTYCQYGEHRMKPTDLWGKFPPTFSARRCRNGDKCHDRTPRGSCKTGTQSIKKVEERALIPYQLSLEICLACEYGMMKKHVW